MGIGAGFIYVPCITVQSHRWKKRRGTAIGIIFIGALQLLAKVLGSWLT